MKNDEEKKTTKIDTSITPLNVTSDGRIILRGGIMIDFMTITCQTPNGASVRPMIMFHTDENECRKIFNTISNTVSAFSSKFITIY